MFSVSAEIMGPQVGVSSNVDKDPEALKGVTVEENYGGLLNLDLKVTNEEGQEVALATYFNQGRPVVINLIYYSCGGTCNALLNGTFMTLKDLDYKANQQFEMLNISFHAQETHELAKAKKENYIVQYDIPSKGIHFLNAKQDVIDEITNTLGFKYNWVPS